MNITNTVVMVVVVVVVVSSLSSGCCCSCSCGSLFRNASTTTDRVVAADDVRVLGLAQEVVVVTVVVAVNACSKRGWSATNTRHTTTFII